MAVPIELTVTIRDGKGENSSFGIYLPSGFSVANAQTFWDSVDQDLYSLIDGEVISVSVSFPLTLDALLAASNIALTTSDVQEKAYFAFKSALGYVKSLNIPTIRESAFQAGSKLIDLADASVAAFVTAMLGSPVTAHDEDITAISVAREAWGKYRP